MSKTERRALNRVLLREAGEHLGALAEQAHEHALLIGAGRAGWTLAWNRYVKLHKASKEVLEIANG